MKVPRNACIPACRWPPPGSAAMFGGALDSNIEGIFGSDFAVDIARRSEAAHLDFVFRPDVSSLPPGRAGDRLRLRQPGSHRTACRGRPRTSRIGLVSTVSTTFYPPYVVARQLQSLHWISNGRAGWNIVTALQGHENFGLDALMRSSATRAPPSSPGWCTTCGTASPARHSWSTARAAATPTFPGAPGRPRRRLLKVKGTCPTCRPSARRGFPGAGRRLPRAGAISPPRWPTWCSRDPDKRGRPGTAPRPFLPRRTPRSLAARRAPAAGLQPVPGGEPRGGAGNLHADPRAPGPAFLPTSGRCSASTSATGR